ncbi:MAG: hypothetical protein RL186_693 [Pseudomonadota bacterium]
MARNNPMTVANPSLVWLRDDLRLDDNPALAAAAKDGPVVALYVLEEDDDCTRPMGGAARWWLHHSLAALTLGFAQHGVTLLLRRGAAARIVPEVALELGAGSVHWNRRYHKSATQIDAGIKSALLAKGIKAQSHKGNVLTEPWEIKTGSGGHFKVFTPFFRAAQPTCDDWAGGAHGVPAMVGGVVPEDVKQSESLASLKLLPQSPDWSGGLKEAWTPGEARAAIRLKDFVASGLKGYQDNRNVPSVTGTSRLSAHIRFGEISIRRVWNVARAAIAANPALAKDGQTFLSELGWREFSTQLIFHYNDFPDQSWKPEFRAFPWQDDAKALHAWQKGQTGYPIVDAGMRELWQTGWMHNRVRMIVASFLVKHLLQDWRLGEAWFWDTLVDADVANNAAGWQWVAGSGADAAPFFRIFNPMTQGEKFDSKGHYVRRYVPELAKLPNAFIHRPFEAPSELLRAAGVTLGVTYPRPLVDHTMARTRALDALASIKTAKAEVPA